MTIESRAQEIVNAMNTFNKAAYHRSEVLPELLALQQEVVSHTFNEEHADLGSLRIWDVERHLEQMNSELGGIADDELQRFESGCKDLCNMIKAEISGCRGELKAFQSLEQMSCQNRVLHNVELTEEEERTEIDAVAVTQKGVFIVEVKNTSRDIFIDENGNYFRTGEYLRWDSNIAEKLDVKTRLINGALKKAGFSKVPVTGIVVFTNNHIEVKNRFEGLNTCFLSQLPFVIQDYEGPSIFDEEKMEEILRALDNARCMETYPVKMDVEKFKHDFAILMATLEEASTRKCDEYENPELSKKQERVESISKRRKFLTSFRSIVGSRYLKTTVSAAAVIAVAVVAAAFSGKHST